MERETHVAKRPTCSPPSERGTPGTSRMHGPCKLKLANVALSSLSGSTGRASSSLGPMARKPRRLVPPPRVLVLGAYAYAPKGVRLCLAARRAPPCSSLLRPRACAGARPRRVPPCSPECFWPSRPPPCSSLLLPNLLPRSAPADCRSCSCALSCRCPLAPTPSHVFTALAPALSRVFLGFFELFCGL